MFFTSLLRVSKNNKYYQFLQTNYYRVIFATESIPENMFLLLTVWINFCSMLMHPMYVSMTNMDIDAHRKSVVLSIRIFTEDLETILHNKYNVDGWIGTQNEHRDSRRLLREYVNERFSIAVNGETLSLMTDSMVISDDMMWFYMKGTASQVINKIAIDNRLLTDFFSKQNNLVIISTGRNEEGYRLNRKTYKIELSL